MLSVINWNKPNNYFKPISVIIAAAINPLTLFLPLSVARH